MLIFSHGTLCRERHKGALMRQQKLHLQVSVAHVFAEDVCLEQKRSRNGE